MVADLIPPQMTLLRIANDPAPPGWVEIHMTVDGLPMQVVAPAELLSQVLKCPADIASLIGAMHARVQLIGRAALIVIERGVPANCVQLTSDDFAGSAVASGYCGDSLH